MFVLKQLYEFMLRSSFGPVFSCCSLASPGIHAPTIFSGPSAEIDRTLLICIEPLLQLVIDNQLFRDVVTAKNQGRSCYSKKLYRQMNYNFQYLSHFGNSHPWEVGSLIRIPHNT